MNRTNLGWFVNQRIRTPDDKWELISLKLKSITDKWVTKGTLPGKVTLSLWPKSI